MLTKYRTFLPLIALAALGCSSSESTGSGGTSGGHDAGPDAPADVTDASSEPGEDATTEAGQDASPDAPEEAGQDAPTDAPTDGPSDGPSDAPTDTQVDAGPEWAELGTGVFVSPPRPAAGETLRIRYEGSLASGSDVTVHYGFNGWNELSGSGATSQDDGTSNLDFYLEALLTPEAGGHVGEVELPAGAQAIHMVFRADVGGSQEWDNNDRRDYNLGVRFPYLGPFLSWLPEHAPSERVQVHFHTGMACEAYVQVGVGTPSNTVVAGYGQMHHVDLTGLSPDTQYSYRVGCEGLAPSETFVFRTAAQGSSPVTFAVASDSQDNGETGRWGEVAAAVETHDPAFLLFAGDMAWNDKPGLWWTFFDRGRSLLSRTPLAAVPGNHDTPTVGSDPDTSTFEWLFGLDGNPGQELTRKLSWGPASLVLMSSETPQDFAAGSGGQYLWAQQTLATLTGAPWVFASMHIPPYNAGVRHLSQQWDFRDLTGLFDGVVDWAFTGHEHLYQRTKPMRYNGVIAPSGVYGRGPDDGVGYVVLPAAGAWPESQIVAWDDPKAHYRDRLAYPTPVGQQSTVPSEQGFTIVSLAGKQITLRTYGLGTPSSPAAVHLVDEVSYTKP